MDTNQYDIIIIGGGPAGYVAAERAGAHGKRVCLIEKDNLGGVCLNAGCIPTKTLLHSAKLYYSSLNSAQFGVTLQHVNYNLSQAMAWKQQTVETLRKGVAYKMKKHNVNVISGRAEIGDKNTILVNNQKVHGTHLILATGSSPIIPPIEGVENHHVMTSSEILRIDKLPKKLVIIGGGIIGIEFASYFSMLGVNVTIIEMLPEILPSLDREIARMFRTSLPNCTFFLNSQVNKISHQGVYFTQNGQQSLLETDMVLLSAGREPNINIKGIEQLHLYFDKKGIRVNEKMQTNIPNVYAIGDVTGQSLLAHSASRMGEVAVSNILGKSDQMRYHAIPSVVYSSPEIASVGLNETVANTTDRSIKVGKLQMIRNGRYLAEHGKQKGLCKIIVDAETHILLGVHIIGAHCSEMIFGAATMIESEMRVRDIREIIFPHPTVSEIIRDCVWEFHNLSSLHHSI